MERNGQGIYQNRVYHIGVVGSKSKYGNRKTVVLGETFDSAREAKRYLELVLLQKQGIISDLKRQVSYKLLPAVKKSDGSTERGVRYIADFTYYDEHGNLVVEDAKGFRTDVYKLKKKMMLCFHGIEVQEV